MSTNPAVDPVVRAIVPVPPVAVLVPVLRAMVPVLPDTEDGPVKNTREPVVPVGVVPLLSTRDPVEPTNHDDDDIEDEPSLPLQAQQQARAIMLSGLVVHAQSLQSGLGAVGARTVPDTVARPVPTPMPPDDSRAVPVTTDSRPEVPEAEVALPVATVTTPEPLPADVPELRTRLPDTPAITAHSVRRVRSPEAPRALTPERISMAPPVVPAFDTGRGHRFTTQRGVTVGKPISW